MQEALNETQNLATEHGNQQLTTEHFLLALLRQSDGIARPLFEKLAVPVRPVEERREAEIERLPKVQGAQLLLGEDLRRVLTAAEREMTALKDEFVSAEHFLLALIDSGHGAPTTEIDPGTLATVGVHDFGGRLEGAMTAHPHTDPVTGELVFFGYSPVAPFLRFHVAAPDGTLVRSETIEVPFPCMMHDAIVTREHVVFLCCPATFRPENLATSEPIRWEPALGTHLGVMPRDGSSDDVVWLQTDASYVFHVMNGWDEPGRVVADVCRFDRLPILERSDQALEEGTPARLTRWTLDLAGGTVKEERLDDRPCEFPRLDDRHACQPYRFGLAAGYAGGDRETGLFDRVVRYDHARGTRSERRLPGRLSEPVFVPNGESAGEGEGFVLALYARMDDGARAELAVLDAEQLDAGPLATVRLPHRIPHGFHANWLSGVTLR